MKPMKAAVFHGANEIRVDEVRRPHAGIGEAAIRVRLTTICGTDLHILRGEYPVKPGLILGNEPVGVIEELGPGVTGYKLGNPVLASAVTPCAQGRACLAEHRTQCGHGEGGEATGGRQIGNTMNGADLKHFWLGSTAERCRPPRVRVRCWSCVNLSGSQSDDGQPTERDGAKAESRAAAGRSWNSPSGLWHRKTTVIAALSIVAILLHLVLRFGFRTAPGTLPDSLAGHARSRRPAAAL